MSIAQLPPEASERDRPAEEEEGRPPGPRPRVGWREIAAVVLLVVLSDLTVYRGQGYAGIAVLCIATPVLLAWGAARRCVSRPLWVVAVLLLLLAAKLVWLGSPLLVTCGFALLAAFAMALAGRCPYVLETLVFASQTIPAGYAGLQAYGERGASARQPRVPWADFLLPLAALLAFGTIFILANPDVLEFVSLRLEQLVTRIRDWLLHFSFWEIAFWVAALWISVGLIRPLGDSPAQDEDPKPPAVSPPPADAPLYAAFFNTLVTVIGLFAVYLVFEFYTLWLTQFPREFFYTGRVHKYAHEGAAWLTLALALATVVLSLIFRGAVLGDPRLASLKRLAWLWSLENALLAVTVYHRLFIYIGFNGMTRMRVVGLLGISTVVVGFLVVVWKIVHHRSFLWLLRRHLWTLAAAVYLYALMPVDAFVVRYNVWRILAGDPAPSVQISVHPISSEGVLPLLPLLESEDAIIREGVRSLLAERHDRAERRARRRQRLGWTAFQLADLHVLEGLRDAAPRWRTLTGPERTNARERFDAYAYQWY